MRNDNRIQIKKHTSLSALGTENVWHLLLQYAIPSVIAMTASSLYNITDSIFIGHGVGALAISGLAITFPLMNLAAAFGSLVGAGASTLMSLRLGQKDYSIATIIAQASMLVWQLKFYSNKANFIHLQKGIFRLKRRIVSDSLSIGMAPFLMNLAACMIVIIINKQLLKYGGDLDVGAYGIINRVGILFVMIVMGLNQGMQPIAGYNYGAKKIDRVKKVLKYSIVLATAIMTVGFFIGEFFPRAVASVFTKDQDLIELVIPGLRIVIILFPIVGFQMVTSNFFQSIGMVKKAIFMSLSRQVIILLPCLLILPPFFGTKGVWYSIPIADMLASLLATYFLLTQYKKFKNMQ